MLELNSQPDRLDLNDAALMNVKQRGILTVVNTDAHSVEELSSMECGVYQARRGGLEAKDVANTRTLAQFRKLLKPRGGAWCPPDLVRPLHKHAVAAG